MMDAKYDDGGDVVVANYDVVGCLIEASMSAGQSVNIVYDAGIAGELSQLADGLYAVIEFSGRRAQDGHEWSVKLLLSGAQVAALREAGRTE